MIVKKHNRNGMRGYERPFSKPPTRTEIVLHCRDLDRWQRKFRGKTILDIIAKNQNK